MLSSIVSYADMIFVVDNNSENKHDVEKICKSFPKVKFVEIGFNSGVHALNIGISLALRGGAELILLLDQDSYVVSEAIKKVLRIIERLHKDTLNKIAVINLPKSIPRDIKRKISRFRGRLIISPHFLMPFSGTIIRANVLKDKGIKIREGFFLDQADFDFFYRLKRLGFLTCMYVDGLLEHKLGTPLLIGRKLLPYENSWRYYLIVRNSTILLLEGVIPPLFYFSQLIGFLYPLWLVEGFRKALKSLITGLAHGLFKKRDTWIQYFSK